MLIILNIFLKVNNFLKKNQNFQGFFKCFRGRFTVGQGTANAFTYKYTKKIIKSIFIHYVSVIAADYARNDSIKK